MSELTPRLRAAIGTPRPVFTVTDVAAGARRRTARRQVTIRVGLVVLVVGLVGAAVLARQGSDDRPVDSPERLDPVARLDVAPIPAGFAFTNRGRAVGSRPGALGVVETEHVVRFHAVDVGSGLPLSVAVYGYEYPGLSSSERLARRVRRGIVEPNAVGRGPTVATEVRGHPATYLPAPPGGGLSMLAWVERPDLIVHLLAHEPNADVELLREFADRLVVDTDPAHLTPLTPPT
jgi:hypothetical protein